MFASKNFFSVAVLVFIIFSSFSLSACDDVTNENEDSHDGENNAPFDLALHQCLNSFTDTSNLTRPTLLRVNEVCEGCTFVGFFTSPEPLPEDAAAYDSEQQTPSKSTDDVEYRGRNARGVVLNIGREARGVDLNIEGRKASGVTVLPGRNTRSTGVVADWGRKARSTGPDVAGRKDMPLDLALLQCLDSFADTSNLTRPILLKVNEVCEGCTFVGFFTPPDGAPAFTPEPSPEDGAVDDSKQQASSMSTEDVKYRGRKARRIAGRKARGVSVTLGRRKARNVEVTLGGRKARDLTVIAGGRKTRSRGSTGVEDFGRKTRAIKVDLGRKARSTGTGGVEDFGRKARSGDANGVEDFGRTARSIRVDLGRKARSFSDTRGVEDLGRKARSAGPGVAARKARSTDTDGVEALGRVVVT